MSSTIPDLKINPKTLAMLLYARSVVVVLPMIVVLKTMDNGAPLLDLYVVDVTLQDVTTAKMVIFVLEILDVQILGVLSLVLLLQ